MAQEMINTVKTCYSLWSESTQQYKQDGTQRSWWARILDPSGLLIEEATPLETEVSEEELRNRLEDDEESSWLPELKREAMLEIKLGQSREELENSEENEYAMSLISAFSRSDSSHSECASDLALSESENELYDRIA